MRRADPKVMAVPWRASETALAGLRGEGKATLIHLAWPNLRAASSGASGADDEEAWQAFVDESVVLRALCDRQDIAFVGVGSGVEGYVGEGLAEPYLGYARRKLALFDALAPTAWVRLHFLFGEGEHAGRLVPSAIRAAISGTAFSCGAPGRLRHWLSVDDLAPALIAFASAAPSGVVDIAGREAISFDALLGLVGEAVGRPVEIAAPAAPVADANLPLIAPQNLAPNLPPGMGLAPNLLARLKEYAVLISAPKDARS